MADPYNEKIANSTSGRAPLDHLPSFDAEKDIESLRSEIANLKSMITDKADKAYEKLSDGASSAASYVKEEATSVADSIREHPAATTTLLTLVGLIGFGLGYLVATSSVESRQSWYRRYLNDKFNFG